MLEPRWEGPYRVKKVAAHRRSAWIEDLRSGEVKRKYHSNSLGASLQRKGRRPTDFALEISRGNQPANAERRQKGYEKPGKRQERELGCVPRR